MAAPIIYINAGHGGKDSGASANGLVEKNINLTVALKLREILTNAGYIVYMSRDKDTDQTMDSIVADIKAKKPNLVISDHHNAGGGDGCELYYQRGSITSKDIAALIEAEYKKIGQNSRGLKIKLADNGVDDYYAILREPYKAGITSVLSEFAFLDSKDKDIIDTIEKQHKEAEAIANGIMAHFKYVKPTASPSPVDNTDYKTLYNTAKATIDALNAKINNLINDKDSLAKQVDALNGSIKSLQSQNSALNTEKSLLNDQIKGLNIALSDLKNNIKALERDKMNLNVEKEDLITEIEVLQKQISQSKVYDIEDATIHELLGVLFGKLAEKFKKESK